jgi:hypothetical protein
MAKKKEATDEVKETKERAAVGRERRLALALAAVTDEAADKNVELEAVFAANELLRELGYNGLESTYKRVARINTELRVAVENSDGDEIARLGKELKKAKSGKASRVKKVEEPS